MTQRRRIAISYLFAVPAVLAIVLVQHIALFRLKNVEGELVRTAEALRQSEGAFSVEQTEKPVSGGVATVQARTAPEPQRLNPAAIEPRSARESKAAQLARLIEQKQSANRTVHFTELVNTFGGILAIWLVGVAAFLLFHDEKARAWTGVERRVHTRIVETLPLGVCLTTVSGGVLYTNPAEEAIFGYGREELIGKDATGLHEPLLPGTGLSVEETIDRLGPGQTWFGDVTIKRKDGAPLKTHAWITNIEVAGKLYRLFVHNQTV